MQRLTLILSDLFLPEEVTAHSPLPRPIELPNFDGLLRFTEAPGRISDWRSWLAEELQQSMLARLPVVVYGAADPKAGACETLYEILTDGRLNHRCQVVSGVLASG